MGKEKGNSSRIRPREDKKGRKKKSEKKGKSPRARL
jgi:hypothetical protein